MKCKKVISEFAKLDIKENAFWYNSKKRGLGKEFTLEIRKVVNYIMDFPMAYQVRYDEIRVAVVDVFPYTVHYYFDQANNTVFITSVFKDSNDPKVILQRY